LDMSPVPKDAQINSNSHNETLGLID